MNKICVHFTKKSLKLNTVKIVYNECEGPSIFARYIRFLLYTLTDYITSRLLQPAKFFQL